METPETQPQESAPQEEQAQKQEQRTAEAPASEAAGTPQEAQPAERNRRRQRVGIVVSDKMQKSITVAIERQVKHSLYGKYVKKTSKIMAHDENDEANEGDTVRIMEARPFSKRKRWRLVEIIERAK